MPNKEYIGDGVYIQGTCEEIILTTEDGISVQNTIILDVDLIKNINRFVDRIVKGE